MRNLPSVAAKDKYAAAKKYFAAAYGNFAVADFLLLCFFF